MTNTDTDTEAKMKVYVVEFRVGEKADWTISEVFISQRMAIAQMADLNEDLRRRLLPATHFEYRVRAYGPCPEPVGVEAEHPDDTEAQAVESKTSGKWMSRILTLVLSVVVIAQAFHIVGLNSALSSEQDYNFRLLSALLSSGLQTVQLVNQNASDNETINSLDTELAECWTNTKSGKK